MDFLRLLANAVSALVVVRGNAISLERAILRDPELLILDKATRALDGQSEWLVQQAIEQFERQHTVLVIAHRLSTIVNAHLICVMDQGRIVERGNDRELLAKDGRYANLWQQQSRQGAQGIPKTPIL